MELDDDTFLERFAARDLGPEYFDHRGHLRMALLHLSRYGVDEANRRVCEGIEALATLFGVPEKYNRTLTEALMRIMAGRMVPGEDFESFLVTNSDLVDDCLGVLGQHYSSERLQSPAARSGWLEPDRKPLFGS